MFPFITIIAYDLAHSVTQVKLLSALKMNAYYEYYIFVYYCNITESLIFFFFSVTGRRKKNKGYGQMLLYFLGASKMTMLYVIMNAVAAIAGKALIVAKVALAIATAIALRKILGWFFFSFFWNFYFYNARYKSQFVVNKSLSLLSEHKERISYEIIKYPYHSYENTHSTSFDYDHHGGSWERDFGYQRQRVNRKLVRWRVEEINVLYRWRISNEIKVNNV